eukprot:8796360-Alexandrium_andersonii.AAC.1
MPRPGSATPEAPITRVWGMAATPSPRGTQEPAPNHPELQSGRPTGTKLKGQQPSSCLILLTTA